MRISDWSSDVCSSDLRALHDGRRGRRDRLRRGRGARMTTTEQPHTHVHEPGAELAAQHERRGPAKGVQSVKFSFFKLSPEARRLPEAERAVLGEALTDLLDRSTQAMVTRAYSTVGTRAGVELGVRSEERRGGNGGGGR